MNGDIKINQADFGAYLKKHREAKHLTQKDLAEAIGVQTKSISYIERGMNYPSTDKLFKMAVLLDFSLDEFIFGITKFNSHLSIPELNDILASIPKKYLPMLMSIVTTTAEQISTLDK